MPIDFEKENEKVTSKQPAESSYWPIGVAFGLLLIVIGIVSTIFISVLGLLILLSAIMGWVEENRNNPEGTQ